VFLAGDNVGWNGGEVPILCLAPRHS